MGGKLQNVRKILHFYKIDLSQKWSGVKASTKAEKVEVLVHSNAAIKVFNLSLIYE